MTARKKVLFLITKATWGGAQRYVYDVATSLPREQFLPIVAYGQRGKLSESLEGARIEMRHIPSMGRDIALFSDIASFFQILICIGRVRPDVVHLNSSKAAAFGALAARILFVPKIIFTVHGWPFNERRGAMAWAFIYYVSMFTALLSNAVIVVSQSDKAQVEHLRRIREKTTYIPIGIEQPQFLSRETACKILNSDTRCLNSDSSRIVTIAELTPNKGIQYAIEAVELLKKQGVDVSYSIIGDGEERERLQALALERGITDRVHFLGFVPSASTYLKSFDIFLLPSTKEGMPYVLLEAAEAGLPMITTTVVNPEFIERVQNVHAVPPADPQALAAALLETMRTKTEKESFPDRTHFVLSGMVEKTIALYR